MSKGMLQEIVVVLLVVVLVMLLLLQLQIVQKVVHGNSTTATTASKCTGNSATATKLQTARNIALSGAVKGNTNFDGSGNATINTELNNIFVFTGTVELKNGVGSTSIDYPTGCNKNNCIPFLSGLNTSGTYYDYGNIQSTCVTGVRMTDSNIQFNCGAHDDIGPTGTKNFRVVIMKIS